MGSETTNVAFYHLRLVTLDDAMKNTVHAGRSFLEDCTRAFCSADEAGSIPASLELVSHTSIFQA